MSTDTGVGADIATAVKAASREFGAYRQSIAEFDFLDPVTAEEVVEAREVLGPKAGTIAIAAEVQRRRGGRRKGSRNRNTGDLVQYLSQFGPDPAVAAMKIIGTSEEMMVARSRAEDPTKRVMTIGEAQAARMRMIELMMPYWHGKKPVQVDLRAHGDFNLLLPGQNISESDAARMADGTFALELADYSYVDPDGAAASSGGDGDA